MHKKNKNLMFIVTYIEGFKTISNQLEDHFQIIVYDFEYENKYNTNTRLILFRQEETRV